MQKIMFNDRYGLTEAVLEGIKTNTRRIEKISEDDIRSGLWREKTRYKVGEVVAIAQAYRDCKRFVCLQESAGWNNKMFVKADLMPHHIKITDIRVERLQDISDEDCIAEGISIVDFAFKERGLYSFRYENEWYEQFKTPREAFACLIDKISGKGTWDKNPYVFVYDFELVDYMSEKIKGMKRVTFEVAKAIKEAGYPQDNVKYIHKVKTFPMYYNGEYIPDYEYFYLNYITDFDFQFCVAAPTYLEAWLWLWREKKIHIEFGDMVYKIYDASEWVNGYGYHLIDLSNKVVKDPEEAIIAAIKYLVDNYLTK